MAHVSLVLTVIGKDRPGLVESLSGRIAAEGASWLESRMAHLGGQFAGLLRLSVPEARAAALEGSLADLEAQGLRVVVARAEGDAAEEGPPRLRLAGVGLDRPGLVREISRALAERGVNVEELESHTSPAPMSGETLFHVRASLGAPAGLDVDALRGALERLADELMVELVLDEEPG